MENKDFIVMCNVCGQTYKNHVGSTECCGSIAYRVDENGKKTNEFFIYAKIKKDGKSEYLGEAETI